MVFRLSTLALALTGAALPALSQEVNVYSHRQPELIQPLIDAFTAQSGITVNIAFVDKGMVERLVAEGKRSPADLVLTVDIARLSEVVNAGVTQPVDSAVLQANIPAQYRDPGNQWFGLTSRARIIYAATDRVAEGEVTTYEDLADPKWTGRICTRSGTHDYNLALLGAVIAHDGEPAAKAWAEGVQANLARKPAGGDRDQVKAIWAGECDIALGNTYYMGQMLADPPADLVDILPEDAAVGPGEIHELECAQRPDCGRGEGLTAGHLGTRQGENLAGLDLRDIHAPDCGQGTCFRCHGVSALGEPPEAERPKSPRVAHCDHPVGGEDRERERSLPCRQGAFEAFLPGAASSGCQHQRHHLGVASRR
jgi:hypothetical protein